MEELQDPVVFEAETTLMEWHHIWVSLYLENKTTLFEEITNHITTVFELRNRLVCLINQNATSQYVNNLLQQIIELKKEIVSILDQGNRLLNLDLIPRDSSFRVVNPNELSPIELYLLHNNAANDHSKSSNVTNLVKKHDSNEFLCETMDLMNISHYPTSNSIKFKKSSHLMLTMTDHSLNTLPNDDTIEIHFSLVDSAFNVNNNNSNSMVRPFTEKFIVRIEQDEIIYGVSSTVFANLPHPINHEICLYIQIYRVGRMTLIEGTRTGFGKQQSNINLYVNNQDSSMNSLISSNRYNTNGIGRNRHSSVILPDTPPIYKRPFGATILSLKELSESPGREYTVSVKIPSVTESEFSLVSDLYNKRNLPLKINPNLPNVQMELSMRFLTCGQGILPKLLATSPCCITEKQGFSDMVMSGDFKNDLYIILESGEFEKGGKSISKNIEASISLIDKKGLVIDGCISPGSNCDNISCYKSCVYYHSNSPKWNEYFKINVPLSEFDTAHLRIEFRHCSTKDREKKFLGFAFLPLLKDDDGTVIADDSHELYIYKCDSQIYEDESLNLCKYIGLPYGPTAKNTSKSIKQATINNFYHSGKEIVTINTYLASSKLTRNHDLLNLLRWRELVKSNEQEFGDTLKRILVIDGDEIVKFLQDILDSLFDTFTLYSTNEGEYSAMIFKVLVHIFLLLEEPEYEHFKLVLDTYVKNHFSATLVYKGLLACVKKCLDCLSMVDRHLPIQKCFRSLKHVFQFIVQSKLLYAKATGEHQDELFLNDIRHLFHMFERMLSCSNSNLITIQVIFLENFPSTLEQLVKVMSAVELAKVITSLAASVGHNLPAPLARAKLIFMRETANSPLLKNQDARIHIIETFCRHLGLCFIELEELEICYQVLETLIIKIHNYHWPSIHRLYTLTSKSLKSSNQNPSLVMTISEIGMSTAVHQHNYSQLDSAIISLGEELEPFVNLIDSLLILLDRLLKDYSLDRRTIAQKYFSCLITIFKLMSNHSFSVYIKQRQVDQAKICNFLISSRALFNREWCLMQLTSHSILEYPIYEIFRDIKSKGESHSNNRQLASYINLMVDYITHPSLQLESFSRRKKEFILRVFGDLRIKYAKQLVKFWSELNKTTINDLIPNSIQLFLDVALFPNDNLQNLIIPIFYDMINAEEAVPKKSNSRQFERCFIDNLDTFMNLDRGSNRFVDNFTDIMQKLISEQSPSWSEKGLDMIKSFKKLMKLLLNYRASLECCENQSKRMSCLVDLLNFYKEVQFDLHVKYLIKLCDMHVDLGNYVEAAFTLKLYSEELIWLQRAHEGYRIEEQEWKRKETLYNRIIDYFDKGECWEEAIPFCKELATTYENHLDYEKWSKILQKLAKFADNILTKHRPEIEYFRIEFFGDDLPEFVRDKEFIYRAGGYERLPSFISQMSSEFPDVIILNYKNKQSIKKGCSGRYMFISTVNPVPFLQDQFKTNQRNINDKIVQYYMNNRLDTFSYDIPIMKNTSQSQTGSKDKSTSEPNVRNLWVGRYILKTKSLLPDILPWTEVSSQTYIELSPIENAIETISKMNLELSKLIISFKNDPNKQIGHLTMRLQGVIEAPVNGGPSVFINAFLRRPPSPNDNRIDIDLLFKLRDLIKQQFSILETGLVLHSKLAPTEVMPLHTLLVERLKEMMQPLEESQGCSPFSVE